MARATSLVIGASGFLGSHVVKRLVADGRRVRVMARTTSNLRGIDGLAVERCYGDVLDGGALRAAMRGCATIFYCVVDTRACLVDATILYRTNVDGARNAFDAALDEGVRRFVFTSTIGTIARKPGGKATEDDPFNWWDEAPPYIRARLDAENLLMRYCRERGLPGIALCVANTYGPEDWGPTPHGAGLAAVAAGRMRCYVGGVGYESVGVQDAARALVLAAGHGRVGERYIVSDRYVTDRELYAMAARAAGVRPPRIRLPRVLVYVMAALSDAVSAIRPRDSWLSLKVIRLWRMTAMDNGKARRELGWTPRPLEESVRKAVAFFQANPAGSRPPRVDSAAGGAGR